MIECNGGFVCYPQRDNYFANLCVEFTLLSTPDDPVPHMEIPFNLPPDSTIRDWQGTVMHRGGDFGAVLAGIEADGGCFLPFITCLVDGSGGVVNYPFHWTLPLTTRNGGMKFRIHGVGHVDNPKAHGWEIQSAMVVEVPPMAWRGATFKGWTSSALVAKVNSADRLEALAERVRQERTTVQEIKRRFQ